MLVKGRRVIRAIYEPVALLARRVHAATDLFSLGDLELETFTVWISVTSLHRETHTFLFLTRPAAPCVEARMPLQK